MDEAPCVVIDDPPTMNLLGLLLGSIIERRVALDKAKHRLQKLRGTVVVEAGQMAISMAFGEGRVTIRRGVVDKPRARVRGSMEALMGIALGGGMVGPWLAGRIKTRGSLPMLLKVLPLMKT